VRYYLCCLLLSCIFPSGLLQLSSVSDPECPGGPLQVGTDQTAVPGMPWELLAA